MLPLKKLRLRSGEIKVAKVHHHALIYGLRRQAHRDQTSRVERGRCVLDGPGSLARSCECGGVLLSKRV